MPAAGYSQSVFWGNETKYASTAVINQDLGAVQSINPTEKNNLIKVRTLGGNRDYKTVIAGKFEIDGSMEYLLQGGAFLRQCFGEDTATTTTIDSGPKIPQSSIYKHVMGSANSPGVNSFPSFTLEFADTEDDGTAANTANLKRTYTGCRVDSMTLSGTVDEPVKVAVDWKAKRVTVSSAAKTSVTAYTEDPLVFYQGFVYMTSGVATCGTPPATLRTSALALCNSFELTLNNNLEAGWYIAGTTSTYDSFRSAKFIIPKGRDYSMRLGLHYANKAMYQRFLGAAGATTDQKTPAKYQVVLDMVRTGSIGTYTSANYMRIVAASTLIDQENIPGGPEDIVKEDLTVFTKGVKCYFVDSDASYK